MDEFGATYSQKAFFEAGSPEMFFALFFGALFRGFGIWKKIKGNQ